jgi:seryl-tRNA synthetase
MIAIKVLREQPEIVAAALKNRGVKFNLKQLQKLYE